MKSHQLTGPKARHSHGASKPLSSSSSSSSSASYGRASTQLNLNGSPSCRRNNLGLQKKQKNNLGPCRKNNLKTGSLQKNHLGLLSGFPSKAPRAPRATAARPCLEVKPHEANIPSLPTTSTCDKPPGQYVLAKINDRQ